MAVAFRTIDAARGWEEIAAQIREAIIDGQLQPGERLRSRRDLAVEFGVSRALVNEALRVLEHSGLIETRMGARGGSFVRVPAADELVRHVSLLIRLGSVAMDQLTDFRIVLEGQNAEWAASRATAEDLERLGGIAAAMHRLARHEPDASTLDELDVEFHIAIAIAARNELSLATVRGITPSLRQLTGLVPVEHAPIAATQFDAIVASVAGHRGAGARRLMQLHIRHFAEVLAMPEP
jgi:GntR family transcriptional regulator, transcriptional repressor for pyruvate dehydrogenase complex